jgi:phosphatidylglycerophosphate synthase
MSVAFAILGAACFVRSAATSGWAHAIDLVLAGLCLQLRLVCNLLDGLVAVEHGKGSTAGPIWNELPDRFADVFFLAGAGYGAGLMGMGEAAAVAGWIAAAAAVTTAYVRELGRGLGFPADFSGPFAKPQRMAALTAAAAVSAFEPLWGWRGQTLLIALAIIALGALVTVARRTLTLAGRLKDRGA